MDTISTLGNAVIYRYSLLGGRDRAGLTGCCLMAILFVAADPFEQAWFSNMCIAGIIISGALISPDIMMLGIAAMIKMDMTDAGGEAWFWETWEYVMIGYIYYRTLLALTIRCGREGKPYREKKSWISKVQRFCMIPAEITLLLGAFWWGEPFLLYICS